MKCKICDSDQNKIIYNGIIRNGGLGKYTIKNVPIYQLKNVVLYGMKMKLMIFSSITRV